MNIFHIADHRFTPATPLGSVDRFFIINSFFVKCGMQRQKKCCLHISPSIVSTMTTQECITEQCGRLIL